jgi:hypothetical protein
MGPISPSRKDSNRFGPDAPVERIPSLWNALTLSGLRFRLAFGKNCPLVEINRRVIHSQGVLHCG